MWWTRTSNIDFSTLSGSIPWLIVRLPCGSRSTQRTRWPDSAKATARLRVVVVFATPPFWFAKLITLARRAASPSPSASPLEACGTRRGAIASLAVIRTSSSSCGSGTGLTGTRLATGPGAATVGSLGSGDSGAGALGPSPGNGFSGSILAASGSPTGSVGSALTGSVGAGSGDGGAETLASGSVGAGSGDGGAGTLASGSLGGAGGVVCGAGISGSGATACGSATSASPFRV